MLLVTITLDVYWSVTTHGFVDDDDGGLRDGQPARAGRTELGGREVGGHDRTRQQLALVDADVAHAGREPARQKRERS